MSSVRLQNLINSNFINYLFIFCFFLYSLFIIKHHYDGHHLGLLYSNALDFISGKIPYKEIFLQYGFLTTLIHSLILIIFDNKLFFISVSGAFFYSLSILLISLSIKKLINSNYSLISTVLILFNHPIPLLPWSNYIVFFFITLSIFLITKKKINFFLLGLFLSLAVLSRQEIIIPIIASFLIFCLINLRNLKKIYTYYFYKLFLGFSMPIICFFIYLLYFEIFSYWKSYLTIPNFYLEFLKTNMFDLIINFIIYFSTKSFFNFIITPQFFLISIILIFNSILIAIKIFNKKKIPDNILYISILSILLSSVSLQIEIFRSYTAVVIGIIPLLYFLEKITNKNLKSNLYKVLILPSIFAIIFYPTGNNSTLKKNYLENSSTILLNKNFNFYTWPQNKINSINLITKILINCDVEYLDNLTFDSLYSTIGNFNRIRMLPYKSSSSKHNNLDDYIDAIKNPEVNFMKKINLEIQKENIILLVNKNNHIYKNYRIQPTNYYSVIKIDESFNKSKPMFLNIFVPNKCIM